MESLSEIWRHAKYTKDYLVWILEIILCIPLKLSFIVQYIKQQWNDLLTLKTLGTG